jgi:nucleolar protein 53
MGIFKLTVRFQSASIEIKLSDEIPDNLTRLKPEGNLIQDRFKSLQKRNMVETRVSVKKKRKYKLKEVESHDYKRFQ